jgi:glycerophosphoryl diester phosphodiesterase
MWTYPTFLAHRGGGKLAPENTIAALRCALAHGFRAVEFDVMLARDGVPVVLHDPYLGRTIAGSGHVYDYDAAELVAMDAGAWFGPAFAGEPVPLFTQFVAFCKAHAIWMNIEIKPAPGFEAATGKAVAELTRAMFGLDIAQDGPMVPLLSSFSDVALAAAREAAPDLPRALLLDTLESGWEAGCEAGCEAGWEAAARRLDAVAIHTSHKHLTAALAGQVKAAGFGLFCYTVNEPARAREILGWGVDALCTDRIDLIGPAGPR